MEVFPLFDLEKVLFLHYFPSKLSQEVEIAYAHLVEVLDVSFGVFDFSTAFHPLIASMKRIFGRFFLLFEYVPHMTHLQIGARELKLSMYIQ